MQISQYSWSVIWYEIVKKKPSRKRRSSLWQVCIPFFSLFFFVSLALVSPALCYSHRTKKKSFLFFLIYPYVVFNGLGFDLGGQIVNFSLLPGCPAQACQTEVKLQLQVKGKIDWSTELQLHLNWLKMNKAQHWGVDGRADFVYPHGSHKLGPR